MSRKGIVAALAGAVVGLWGIAPAMAQETGLAEVLHTMRREGGRVCFLDHFHYGNSYGQPSKKAAEIDAIRSWGGLVDLEYGRTWANFRKAASKKMDCQPSGASWGCSVEARPCK